VHRRGDFPASSILLFVEELEPRFTPANPPTLTWVTIPGAVTYDVWVADLTMGVSPIARNTNVTTTSWTVFRPLNPDDTFEWWVRGISATGVKGPWSDGIIFTVTSLPAPVPVSPVGGTFPGVAATLTWTAVPGATSYDVWVNDASSGQSEFSRNTEVSGTSWMPLTFVTPGHAYTWWVRASSSSFDFSNWSSAATFVVTGTGVPSTGSVSTAPTNLALSGSLVKPTFNWGPVTGADFFDLWVDDITTGQSEVVRTQVSTLAFTARRSLTPGDTYTWWVRGGNATGARGPWSPGFTFVVGGLVTPVLIGPSGSVSQSALVLTWNAVSGANFFDVWIDDLSTGQSQVVRTQVSGTSLTPTLLPAGHTFEWWVKAWTTNGGSSAWSDPLIFTIVG
jgi:hypothetical protein